MSLNMHRLMSLLAIAACLLFHACKPAAPLFQRSVSDPKQANPLVLTFEEVSRTGNISVVRISFTSGTSVASSMWYMRCLCGLAKARGATHFVVLRNGRSEKTIGFCNDASIDPRTYFSSVTPTESDLKVTPVTMFERIVGDAGKLGPGESGTEVQ